jgi:hypothetical protein
MDSSGISFNQLGLVLIAIVLGALMIRVLFVGQNLPANESLSSEKGPLPESEPSLPVAQQARAAEVPTDTLPPSGKPLPVRVLYASSLGTAKGKNGFHLRMHPRIGIKKWAA